MKPTQFELFPVPSPCIGVCTTNSKGYCLGCYRSRNERFNWNDMTPVQKMRVIDLCKKRKEIVEQKRQEKAQKQQEQLIEQQEKLKAQQAEEQLNTPQQNSELQNESKAQAQAQANPTED